MKLIEIIERDPVLVKRLLDLWEGSVRVDTCDFIQFNQCRTCDDMAFFSVGSKESCSFFVFRSSS